MDAKREVVSKRLQISKANMFIVVVVSIASFVSVFALTASKALYDQQRYQDKVITIKEEAKRTLDDNLKARDTLVEQYQSFALQGVNIIGGYIDGQNDRDGDNPQLILDSLPSKYDYPALITSIEKMLSSVEGITIKGISGVDDSLQQSDEGSSEPTAVEVPFSIDVQGKKVATEEVLSRLQRSIRPMHISAVSISGNEESLNTSLTSKSYYQPEKVLTINKQQVPR